MTKKVKIEVQPPDDGPGEIFRLLEPLEAHEQTVFHGMELEVEQRGDHGRGVTKEM